MDQTNEIEDLKTKLSDLEFAYKAEIQTLRDQIKFLEDTLNQTRSLESYKVKREYINKKGEKKFYQYTYEKPRRLE
jgi:hypothetical protein